MDKKGRVKKQQIGNLVDKNIEKYGSVKSIQGHEICSTSSGIKVASINTENKSEFKEVKSLIRHKTAKDIYEITTNSGKRIKVTEDHSLFTLGENAKLKKIAPLALKEGECIVGIQKLPSVNLKIKDINVLDHLNKLEKDKYFIVDSKVPELVKRYKNKFLRQLSYRPRPKGTIHWWVRNKIMRLDAAAAILDLEKDLSKNVKIKLAHSKAISPKIKLNSAFLEFLGLWIADGCFDHHTKSIVISAPQEENMKVIHQFGKQFGLEVKKHSDGFSCLIHSRVLYFILKDIFGLKHYAKEKRVPELIFNLNNEQVAAFLRGYFSGDCAHGKYELGAASQAIKLLEDISNLLARFDIHTKIDVKPDKTNTYKLRVSQIENVKRFEKIGFIRKDHANLFKNIINRKKASHDCSNILPLPKWLLWQIIDESKVLVGNRWTYKTWKTLKQRYKKSFIGKQFLNELAKSGALSNNSLEKITPLLGEDIRFEKVKSIRKIKHSGYVYDLSVDKSERFVSGSQILCSNTAELRLPHINWMPQISRAGFGTAEYGEISMYDLLKAALRQRPDYLIVGEVRGKEANVLFHAMSTGHPGLSTLHADNFQAVIDRLTTRPIELSLSLLENLDIIIFLEKAKRKDKLVRKIDHIVEVEGFDPDKNRLKTNEVFRWVPSSDTFENKSSSLLHKIASRAGITAEEIQEELLRRVRILEWMKQNKIHEFEKVSEIIRLYYVNPRQLDQIMRGVQVAK